MPPCCLQGAGQCLPSCFLNIIATHHQCRMQSQNCPPARISGCVRVPPGACERAIEEGVRVTYPNPNPKP